MTYFVSVEWWEPISWLIGLIAMIYFYPRLNERSASSNPPSVTSNKEINEQVNRQDTRPS